MATPNHHTIYYFHTNSPLIGETYYCPVTLELRFYQAVFNAPLRFVSERFPRIRHNRLPYTVDPQTCKLRQGEDDLINCIAKLCWGEGNDPWTSVLSADGAATSHADCLSEEEKTALRLAVVDNIACSEMVEEQLTYILMYCMWIEEDVYNNFTQPTIINSVPWLHAYYACWREKRAAMQLCASHGLADRDTVLGRLKDVMSALAHYLKGNKYFGGHKPSFLDARVFAYLAVLYSLPIVDNINFEEVMISQPSLLRYCQELNEKYTIWRNEKSFLFGLRAGNQMNGHRAWRKRNSSSSRSKSDDMNESSPPANALWIFTAGVVVSCILYVLAGNSPVKLLLEDEEDDEDEEPGESGSERRD